LAVFLEDDYIPDLQIDIFYVRVRERERERERERGYYDNKCNRKAVGTNGFPELKWSTHTQPLLSWTHLGIMRPWLS
jgi:hypothetical protein